MKLLVSHTNYPAQFRRFIPLWLAEGHDVVFLFRNKEWHSVTHDRLRLCHYNRSRESQNPYLHPYLRRLEASVLEGQAAFRKALDLKNDGWIPDVVVSHVGFGNGLFLKDLFPNSFRIGLIEWFYNA